MTKPVLPYLGTKRHHLQFIQDNMPVEWSGSANAGTYIEPFLGSGVVFQHINPDRAILSDSSQYVMGLHVCIQKDVDRILWELKVLYDADSPELYKKCKVALMESPDEFKRAAMFAYVQKASLFSFACPRADGTAFRGSYRPYKGKMKLDDEVWKSFARKLGGANISLLQNDFATVMDLSTAGDFMFLDPPYIGGSNTRTYQRFSRLDHERLMRKIQEASARGVYIMLFNHAGMDVSDNSELHASPVILPHRRVKSSFENYKEHIYTNY